MPDPKKLHEQSLDLIAAWDERKRTFETMRDLELSDEQREKAVADYAAASKTFEQARHALLKT